MREPVSTTTYTAGVRQDFLGDTAGTAGINIGGIAAAPTTQVDGDIWLDNVSNQIFGRINGVDIDLGAGAAGGEINTGANVGSGTGQVFRDKTGVTLNFKTLLQGANIIITDNADDITIAATSNVVGPGTSTDEAIVRFDGTTGELIQDGIITIDDLANMDNIRSAIFTTHTTTPGAGTTHIALVDNDFHINTISGNNVQILVQGTTEYQFDSTIT